MPVQGAALVYLQLHATGSLHGTLLIVGLLGGTEV